MEQRQIEAYFAEKESLLVESISRLVRIDSTIGDPEPGKPFGPGPAQALDEALALARDFGLPGENLSGYVGVVDLNQEETALHILGHLDVVDPGTGWTVTEPFQPKVVDGLLYGRGVDDDKGPMVAALLAMKAVKDLGFPLKYNARVILGTDEETGFRDIHWYYDRHPYAPHTFSPDAGFPIINTEKGHYQPYFGATWPQETAIPRITSFLGGPRINVVPPTAQAEVTGLSLETVRGTVATMDFEPEIQLTFSATPEGIQIACSGQSAHGSTPEEGHNAQTALVALLTALPLADCPSTRAISHLHRLFPHGDFTGQALGIAQKDALSGSLTLAFTMLTVTEVGLEARFDCRTPLCGTRETIQTVTEAAMSASGFTIRGEIDPPHHVPADTPFLQTLSKCFTQYTGRESACLSTGGGTYVHGIPGGVAFGASMPGFHSNLHGPDERASIADLLTAAQIFTQVIVDLCR